ncbi:MAG: hypothetical protein K0S41_3318 [Anaerocolumna sp.]|jgi:hypothetical protein|nr:hypothetical protein [Anaerocolumna sp.]
MEKKKVENTLSGFDNKRLGQVDSTNNEGTAAWANMEKMVEESHVSIPSEYDVEKAKNWVDNGSKL